jgi:hypothetical protein
MTHRTLLLLILYALLGQALWLLALTGSAAARATSAASLPLAPDATTPAYEQIAGAGSTSPGLCPPNWNLASSPNPLTNNYLYGITAVSAGDVWAVGYYYDFNGGSQGGALIEHWDGTQWTIVPSPAPRISRLYGIDAISSQDIWAVGYYQASGNSLPQTFTMHWDGAAWAIVPSPNIIGPNELVAVSAIATGDVWAVGDTPGNHGTLTEHWNGSYWAIVPSPPESFGDNYLLTSVAAVAPNDVWAVGYHDRGSGSSATLIEHWDGAQWSIVPSPNPGAYYGSLYGVTAIASDDLWAVGAYSNDGGSTYPSMMLHWNGTQWTVVPGNSPHLYNSLRGVAAAAPDDIWAVGLSADCYLCLTFDTLIQHWDGTRWSVVPSPNGNNQFNRLRGVAVVSPGEVWTAGYSDQYNFPYRSDTLTERHTCPPAPTPTGTPPTVTPTPTSTPTRTATVCTPANSNYTIDQSTGAALVPGTDDVGLHCDYCTATVNLPFSFTLYGRQFNNAIAGSNGTLGFVANSNNWRTTCMPSQEFDYAILPFWQQLHMTGGSCPNCGIFTSVTGSAPNRIFNIEWRARDYFYTANVNFEIRLYETAPNGQFEVIYAGVPQGSNQQTTVGVQKERGLLYTQFQCENGLPRLTGGLKLTFTQPLCGNTTPTATLTPPASTTTPSSTGTPAATSVTGTPTTNRTPGQATSTPSSTSTPVVTGTPSTATVTPTPTTGVTNTSTPCATGFSDVHPSDYFYDAVSYLSCQGVISGYSDGSFRPFSNATRGQLAKIVVLAERWPINITGGPHFNDVPTANPFYPFIETAFHAGIISGYADGTFRWGNNVTRAQLAKIVVGARGWPIDTQGGPHFTDVAVAHPFYTFVETAYHHGVISGYADGTFQPGNNATRGQISKIIYSAITRP